MKEKCTTYENVVKLLDYDPKTGGFRWKQTTGRCTKGSRAGGPTDTGYWRIGLLGWRFKAHRLAWIIMTGSWPKHLIDHINGNGFDNRFKNLRSATHSQNLCNSKIRNDNASGYKGVSYYPNYNKWVAYITINQTRKTLGYFCTRESAYATYCAAAKKNHGVFTRTK